MVNQVILIGRLGDVPEVKDVRGGDGSVCNFSIATNEGYYDKQDKWVEVTQWHKIVAWNKLATRMSDMEKGQLLYIMGSLSNRKYQDKQGVDHYTTEIVANQIKKLNNKAESKDNTSSGKTRDNSNQNKGRKNQPPPPQDEDDDLPF